MRQIGFNSPRGLAASTEMETANAFVWVASAATMRPQNKNAIEVSVMSVFIFSCLANSSGFLSRPESPIYVPIICHRFIHESVQIGVVILQCLAVVDGMRGVIRRSVLAKRVEIG